MWEEMPHSILSCFHPTASLHLHGHGIAGFLRMRIFDQEHSQPGRQGVMTISTPVAFGSVRRSLRSAPPAGPFAPQTPKGRGERKGSPRRARGAGGLEAPAGGPSAVCGRCSRESPESVATSGRTKCRPLVWVWSTESMGEVASTLRAMASNLRDGACRLRHLL